jgi:putative transcriptional regulator
LQDTINSIAHGLYDAEIIDKKTLTDLSDEEPPVLNDFTGEEIQPLGTESLPTKSFVNN